MKELQGFCLPFSPSHCDWGFFLSAWQLVGEWVGLNRVPISSMKKLLTLTILALATSSAMADKRLHGQWEASNADNGALRGTMTLSAKGDAELHPEGHDPVQGTWTAKKTKSGNQLTLTLQDVGSSSMEYEFKGNKLVLTYDNGNRQQFVKSVAQKTPSKPAAAKGASSSKDTATQVLP